MEYRMISDNEVEKEIEIKVPLGDIDQYINKEVIRVQKELTLKGFLCRQPSPQEAQSRNSHEKSQENSIHPQF